MAFTPANRRITASRSLTDPTLGGSKVHRSGVWRSQSTCVADYATPVTFVRPRPAVELVHVRRIASALGDALGSDATAPDDDRTARAAVALSS